MFWIKIAAFVMLTGVGTGAFGAHGLRTKLEPTLFEVFKVAVLYQLIHGLGLFMIGLLKLQTEIPRLDLTGIFMFTGIILFSGSLYILCLTGQRWLGAVTPLGGSAFLLGWLTLFWAVWRQA